MGSENNEQTTNPTATASAVDPKAEETATPQPTQQQIDKAMAELFESEGTAQTPKVDEDPEEGEEAKPGDDEPPKKQPPGWNPQIDKQNRTIAGLHRDVADLKKLVKDLATAPAKTPEQREQKADAEDLMAELAAYQDDDSITKADLRKVINKVTGLVDKAKNERQKPTESDVERERELADIRAERNFNADFKLLAGRWKALSDKAYEMAEDALGDDAEMRDLRAAANGFMTTMARQLTRKLMAGKPVKEEPSKKPGSPTKGAATPNRSAAQVPTIDPKDPHAIEKAMAAEWSKS